MFLSGDSLYEAYIIIYIIGLAPFYIHQMNRVINIVVIIIIIVVVSRTSFTADVNANRLPQAIA